MATIQEVRSNITNDENVGKIRRGTDAPVIQRRLLPSADGAITQLSALLLCAKLHCTLKTLSTTTLSTYF